MLYFANPCTEQVRSAMSDGLLGFIDTPRQGNDLVPGAKWCADNGCFSDRWDAGEWWAWLDSLPRDPVFAVAPDVVADHAATLERFDQWEAEMHDAGFPVAFVAQDGSDPATVPWERCEAVFIGGSTEWKLSVTAERIVAEANRRSVWAHIGRVNSLRRLRWASDIGADSCDGTYLTFGPDQNLPKLLRWLRQVNQQTSLNLGGAA